MPYRSLRDFIARLEKDGPALGRTRQSEGTAHRIVLAAVIDGMHARAVGENARSLVADQRLLIPARP